MWSEAYWCRENWLVDSVLGIAGVSFNFNVVEAWACC